MGAATGGAARVREVVLRSLRGTGFEQATPGQNVCADGVTEAMSLSDGVTQKTLATV
jgi:hypothetical protein